MISIFIVFAITLPHAPDMMMQYFPIGLINVMSMIFPVSRHLAADVGLCDAVRELLPGMTKVPADIGRPSARIKAMPGIAALLAVTGRGGTVEELLMNEVMFAVTMVMHYMTVTIILCSVLPPILRAAAELSSIRAHRLQDLRDVRSRCLVVAPVGLMSPAALGGVTQAILDARMMLYLVIFQGDEKTQEEFLQ